MSGFLKEQRIKFIEQLLVINTMTTFSALCSSQMTEMVTWTHSDSGVTEPWEGELRAGLGWVGSGGTTQRGHACSLLKDEKNCQGKKVFYAERTAEKKKHSDIKTQGMAEMTHLTGWHGMWGCSGCWVCQDKRGSVLLGRRVCNAEECELQ